MGLLAVLAGGAAVPPLPPSSSIIDPERATVPYLIGASGNLNPPVPIAADHVGTVDGSVTHNTSGSYVHPSVLDFHGLSPSGLFGGHRYWMANSEYSWGWGLEDTMILCSDDAYTWRQPAGAAPGVLWRTTDQLPYLDVVNTDNELAYDAAAGELVCMWRQDSTPGRLWHSKTTDGITWTTPLLVFSEDRTTFISPSIVPDGAGGWIMISWGGGRRRTAPALTGPWSAATTPTGLTGWHGGVWRDPDSGAMLAVAGGSVMSCLRSSDQGNTWTVTAPSALPLDTSAWEVSAIYRPTLQPHPNGTHMRVWYSTNGYPGPDNRTGYTILPRSLWEG